MTDVVSVGSNSATKGPGQRAGSSWRTWSEPYERPVTRPAPTVDGKAATAWAVHAPGQRRLALDQRHAVRLSVEDLGVLQGFRRDYPWRGNKAEQGQQVGNAIPPPLAAAVLAAIVKDRSDSVTVADPEVLDLCAGPGGWDEGVRMLDPALHELVLGIEWDEAACATREAAGHRTVKADIAVFDPLTLRGIRGLIASPPCTLFSQAGTGVGRSVLDLLADAIWRMLHGEDCREEVRAAIYPTTRAALDAANAKRVEAGRKAWTEEQVEQRARTDAYIAALVLEPARYIAALDDSLEWLAFEQVPAVLPLWKIYVTALRKLGWSAWCGELNAADYGVPQTRVRAILIARRTGAAQPPEATHQEGGSAEDLFGVSLPEWVSMADALGWTAGRVGFPRKDDRGDSPDGYRERDWRGTDEPAFAVTEKARSWTREEQGDEDGNDIPAADTPDVELVPGSWADGRGGNRRTYGVEETAPTLHFGNDSAGWQWRVSGSAPSDEEPISGNAEVSDPADDVSGNPEASPQVSDAEPLPEGEYVVNTGRDWKPGGDRLSAQRVPVERPAPSVDTRGRWWIERVNDQTGSDYDLTWPESRPATTIASRPLVPHPGPNANRFNGSTKSRNDGLRVTAEEAAVIQSFPPDYPWQGVRTKVFEQIGNAVPPQLAAHVVAAALGRTYAGEPVKATLPPRDAAALRNNNQANAAVRTIDEPAGTMFFGARLNTVLWDPAVPSDEPLT